MSDTDDTEKLLLIPPDHFLVCTSDSEYSFNDCECLLDDHKSRRYFVDDISEKVDKLKIRLEKLENVSISEPSSRKDLTGPLYFKSHRSTDINRLNINNNGHTFPGLSSGLPLEFNTSSSSSTPNNHSVYRDSIKNRFVERKFSDKPFLPVNLQRRFSVSSFESDTTSAYSIDSCTKKIPKMEDDSSSVLLTPQKKQDNFMLSEIDAFLDSICKVDNHMTSFEESGYLNMPTYNNWFHDDKKVDSQQVKELKRSDALPMDPLAKCRNWQTSHDKKDLDDVTEIDGDCRKIHNMDLGSLKNSVPDLGLGMRDIMYSKSETPSIEKPVLKQSAAQVASTQSKIEMNEYNASCDKFHPRELKTRSQIRPSVIDPYVEIKKDGMHVKENTSFIQPKLSTLNFHIVNSKKDHKIDYQPPKCKENINQTVGNTNEVEQEFRTLVDNQDDSQSNLPSLTDLWGMASITKRKNGIEMQKLEEERLRRVHCEEMIQDLQKDLLEQQQKLAIAIQIDSAKDNAISKLRHALVEMTNKISSIDRSSAQKVDEANFKLKLVLEENADLNKKFEHNKSEMARAQQFAEDSQEKCKMEIAGRDMEIAVLKNDIEKYRATLADKEDRYSELKESNGLVVQLNRQMSENSTSLQTVIEKMKQEQCLYLEEINHLKKIRENLENESTVLINERNDLRLIISEEKSRNSHLETQKNKFQTLLEASEKKMKTLDSEFQSFKQQSEDQKNEQKVFYQKQVENIVMSKLDEFQNQLNAAESLMENEMQSREKTVALQFAKQMQKVEQQHKLEVGILEEKHKEEIKLYRIQLAQSSQKIQSLENKLTSYKNKRGLIAAQLHNVMENQWQQALKILTNGTSSENQYLTANTESQAPAGSQQIPSSRDLKPLESNAFPESQHKNGFNINDCEYKNYERFERPLINHLHRGDSANSKHNSGDTALKDDDLQRYVRLLLQKIPGVAELNDKDTQSKPEQTVDYEFPTSDKHVEHFDKRNERHPHGKPPWK